MALQLVCRHPSKPSYICVFVIDICMLQLSKSCTWALPLQVYVLRDYFLSVLSLEWREWMTNEFTTDYFKDRSFYQVQAGALVDNPDQRITNDVR